MYIAGYTLVDNTTGEVVLDASGNPIKDTAGKPTYKKNNSGEYELKSYYYAFTDEFQLERIDKFVFEGNSKGEKLENLVEYNFERPEATPWYQLYLPYIKCR